MANYPKGHDGTNGQSASFDAKGNSLVEPQGEAGIYLASFDMAEMRKHREKTIWGGAFRRPQRYGTLVDGQKPAVFERNDAFGEKVEADNSTTLSRTVFHHENAKARKVERTADGQERALFRDFVLSSFRGEESCMRSCVVSRCNFMGCDRWPPAHSVVELSGEGTSQRHRRVSPGLARFLGQSESERLFLLCVAVKWRLGKGKENHLLAG